MQYENMVWLLSTSLICWNLLVWSYFVLKGISFKSWEAWAVTNSATTSSELIGCGLLVVTVLHPSNVWGHIRMVPTCDNTRSWQHSSTAPRGPSWYPPQSHYPDTVSTSPGSISVMLITRLGSHNNHVCKSLHWLGWDSHSWPSASEAFALPI